MVINPKISVALATYNGEKYLKEQLDSIFCQTINPFEVIACDDQSSDSTIEILKEYQQKHSVLKVYVNNQKLGVTKNFEKAISLCIGDYVALADQDDVWLNEKLEVSFKKMMEIETTNKPSLVFSDLEFVDDNLNTINPSFWKHLGITIEKETFKKLLFRNSVTGSTVLINKLFQAELTNIPSAVLMHDHWIALIAFSFGCYGYIKRPMTKYRQHTRNVINNFNPSAFSRIQRISLDRNYRKNYLAREIAQAKAFFENYKNKINIEHTQDICTFIGIANKAFILRKIISYLKLK